MSTNDKLLLAAVALLALVAIREMARPSQVTHSDVIVMTTDGRDRRYPNAVPHFNRYVVEVRDDSTYRLLARVPQDSLYAVQTDDIFTLARDTVSR